jgi:diaminopimelate epimerase
MIFWKYHGIGNDFILLDCLKEKASMDPAFVRKLCDRNFGIGADGILYVLPGEGTDVTMRIMNADGSEAEMCGNGIRCVAKYVFDNHIVKNNRFTIHTLAGDLEAYVDGLVEINMGPPILDCRKIPMDCDGEFVNKEFSVNGKKLHGNGVSMGNPHLVIFDPLNDKEIDELGPMLERHPLFPKHTNVEFADVREGKITIRVYERGAAWTMACGTGACATAVAAALNGMVSFDRPIDVKLPGGWLKITVDKDMRYVMMAGPAELVYRGEIQ